MFEDNSYRSVTISIDDIDTRVTQRILYNDALININYLSSWMIYAFHNNSTTST
jgi:hypothetical protein